MAIMCFWDPFTLMIIQISHYLITLYSKILESVLDKSNSPSRMGLVQKSKLHGDGGEPKKIAEILLL